MRANSVALKDDFILQVWHRRDREVNEENVELVEKAEFVENYRLDRPIAVCADTLTSHSRPATMRINTKQS